MNQTSAPASSARIDLLGTCLSLVCALRCLSVPFLVTVPPLVGAGMLLGGMAWGPVHRGVGGNGQRSPLLGFPAAQAMAGVDRAGAAPIMIAVGCSLASEPCGQVRVVVGAVVLAGRRLLNCYLCLTCVV